MSEKKCSFTVAWEHEPGHHAYLLGEMEVEKLAGAATARQTSPWLSCCFLARSKDCGSLPTIMHCSNFSWQRLDTWDRDGVNYCHFIKLIVLPLVCEMLTITAYLVDLNARYLIHRQFCWSSRPDRKVERDFKKQRPEHLDRSSDGTQELKHPWRSNSQSPFNRQSSDR